MARPLPNLRRPRARGARAAEARPGGPAHGAGFGAGAVAGRAGTSEGRRAHPGAEGGGRRRRVSGLLVECQDFFLDVLF